MDLPGLTLWTHLSSPPVFSTTIWGLRRSNISSSSSSDASATPHPADRNPSPSPSTASDPPPYSTVVTTLPSASAAALKHILRYGVPAVDLAVFAAWRCAPPPAPPPRSAGFLGRLFRGAPRPPPASPLFRFLSRNFVLNLPNLVEGRWWNFLTASFSHRAWWHLFYNLAALQAVTQVALAPGSGIEPADFAVVLLGSALAGNAACLWNPLDALHNTLGASAVVCGLTSFVAFASASTQDVHMFGMPLLVAPAPVAIAVAGVVDFLLLGSTAETRVAHAGHLGGAAFGLAYYWVKTGRLVPRCWRKAPEQLETAGPGEGLLAELRAGVGKLGMVGRAFAGVFVALCFRLSVRMSILRDARVTGGA